MFPSLSKSLTVPSICSTFIISMGSSAGKVGKSILVPNTAVKHHPKIKDALLFRKDVSFRFSRRPPTGAKTRH